MSAPQRQYNLLFRIPFSAWLFRLSATRERVNIDITVSPVTLRQDRRSGRWTRYASIVRVEGAVFTVEREWLGGSA